MKPQPCQGTVVSIQICTGHRQPMKWVERSEIIADFGLRGDQHARSGSKRQVLLIERETLDALGLPSGEVKENITTEGIDLKRLVAGQKLLLGGSIRIEITQPCEPCARMDEIREGLRRELEGRRGMLARVLTEGWLCVGDSIAMIPEEGWTTPHPGQKK
jgi:MOSC domain-containing protein YiiM